MTPTKMIKRQNPKMEKCSWNPIHSATNWKIGHIIMKLTTSSIRLVPDESRTPAIAPRKLDAKYAAVSVIILFMSSSYAAERQGRADWGSVRGSPVRSSPLLGPVISIRREPADISMPGMAGRSSTLFMNWPIAFCPIPIAHM